MSNGLSAAQAASSFAPAADRDGFGRAIQDELASLADIDTRYQALRDDLVAPCREPALRERRARRLDKLHRQERQPHVLRLAELYREATTPAVLLARRLS